MLNLAEALKEVEKLDSRNTRIPFSVMFCTADRTGWKLYKQLRDKLSGLTESDPERIEIQNKMSSINIGGDVIVMNRAVLSGAPPIKTGIRIQKSNPGKTKNPNHFQNKTRNFKNIDSHQIRKAHIRLILKVNDQEVLY